MAEIVDGERRQADREPCHPDRSSAEMAEIGVERLGPGHHQEHGAERQQSDLAMADDEAHAVHRVERGEHARVLRDVPGAARGKRYEPHDRDRAEERGDPRRAARLHGEQAEQDHHRERYHEPLERRRDHLEAFDRRQHRQRRGDHGIAVEQRRADHAEQDDGEALAAERAMGERHQGKRAAFAVVVGAQQDDHIFDGDDEDQRPDDERKDAENGLSADRRVGAAGRQHRLAQGIKRARADVAIDDADRSQCQRPEFRIARSFRFRAVDSSAAFAGLRHCEGGVTVRRRKLRRLSIR